jgi:hypothetical protein
MYIQGSPAEIQTATLEPGCVWYDSPAACVVALQNLSNTLFSLHFHFHKQKFGTYLKTCYYFIFLLFKIAQLEIV